MIVYGLDFTSNPTKSKRLTLAECGLIDGVLTVQQLHPLQSERSGDFTSFENWLSCKEPWTAEKWIAGLDFPFGMALEAIEHFKWCPPDVSRPTWDQCLRVIFQTKEKIAFRKLIEGWRHSTRKGDTGEFIRVRRPRLTDRLASSGTPMNFYPPVVCPMFFQGARRLVELADSISIPPLKVIDDAAKHIVEAYPRLVVNTVIGSQASYKEKSSKKHDKKDQQSTLRQQDEAERKMRRQAIIDAFSGGVIEHTYGFAIDISDDLAKECVEDINGDKIDSVLCAIQAAWAYRQPRMGMPEFSLDVLQEQVNLEGWIADPYVEKRYKDGES
ncbi:DUF429 domain-containing protein [Rubripirellula sp.]|nr:DUF429 domain-containing protein [Rubripirellula sp.]